jgi:hypothetical protein
VPLSSSGGGSKPITSLILMDESTIFHKAQSGARLAIQSPFVLVEAFWVGVVGAVKPDTVEAPLEDPEDVSGMVNCIGMFCLGFARQ